MLNTTLLQSITVNNNRDLGQSKVTQARIVKVQPNVGLKITHESKNSWWTIAWAAHRNVKMVNGSTAFSFAGMVSPSFGAMIVLNLIFGNSLKE